MDPERLQQIEELYHAAREQGAEERESLLAQADPELRRYVESLLDRDGLKGPLEQPAFELLASATVMQLPAGTQIGPYAVETLLGRGGMGEVYRARDVRLKRSVALKVLPAALADDPERMIRFQREAEILAFLNHPNIAAIYGVEHAEGRQALAMELVEGASPKGPLPVDEAWHIASQIADALEYAHDRGIVHRDLKPANIKITRDGVVKLLDFGLAKAFIAHPDAVAGSANPDDSPTLTIGATEAGMILGTAAYMSPEQARGRPVDKRTDIWAFGVVLYELLTGERLFHGEDSAEILAAVIHKQPDLSRVPAKARALIERCLEKDPKKRLRDIGEAQAWLEAGPSAAPSSGPKKPVAWVIAAAFGIVAAAVVSWIVYRPTRQPELKPLVRLDVDLGADVSIKSPYGTGAVLSPDGTRIVYLSQGKLFTRRLDLPKSTELAGTVGAFSPFISPDGRWVAFFDGKKLNKLSVDGGSAIALCDASPNAMGGSWGDDGNIVAALNDTTGLSKISSAGGTPVPLTMLATEQATHRWPQVLPGSKAVIYTSHTSILGFDHANIEAISLTDQRQRMLIEGGTFGRYLPTSNGFGYLIYINGNRLFAASFDPDKLELRGPAVPVVEQVAVESYGSAQIAFSQTGTLIYRESGATQGRLAVVRWMDGTENRQPFLSRPDRYARMKLSPDGERLAFNLPNGSGWDIWLYEWRKDKMMRLVSGGSNLNPVWSPDGRYIVYEGDGGMFWTLVASGSPQPLTRSKNPQFPLSFAPDGKRLAFVEVAPSSTFQDLWTIPLEGAGTGLRAGKPEVLLQTPFNELYAAFSPDGRWFAYNSDESGTDQVYVRAYPDNGVKWQISNDRGMFPAWSRNGRDLLFLNSDKQVMAARYTLRDDAIIAEKPRVWSRIALASNDVLLSGTNFDIAPDGRRIVALVAAEGKDDATAEHHVVFLENFFDELQRKVPLEGKQHR